jgi:hypothetical protein
MRHFCAQAFYSANTKTYFNIFFTVSRLFKIMNNEHYNTSIKHWLEALKTIYAYNEPFEHQNTYLYV